MHRRFAEFVNLPESLRSGVGAQKVFNGSRQGILPRQSVEFPLHVALSYRWSRHTSFITSSVHVFDPVLRVTVLCCPFTQL